MMKTTTSPSSSLPPSTSSSSNKSSFLSSITRLVSLYASQFYVLLYKNALAAVRSVGWWVCVLAPMIITLIVLIIDRSIPIMQTSSTGYDYPSIIPKCPPGSGNKCFSLLFSPYDSILAQTVMSEVSSLTGLSLAEGDNKDGDIIGMANYTNVKRYFESQTNLAFGAILFDVPAEACFFYTPQCNTEFHNNTLNSSTILPDFTYTTIYNQTYSGGLFSWGSIDTSPMLMATIDQAVLNIVSRSPFDDGRSRVSVSSTNNGYPYRRLDWVSTDMGQVFWIFSLGFYFIHLTVGILSEKERKLRQGLALMGIRSSTYVLSWSITSFVTSLISVLLFLAVGYMCKFAVFANTNFFAHFFLWMLFALAMGQLTVLVGVLLPNTKAGIAFSILVYFIGITIHCLNLPDIGFLLSLIYTTKAWAHLLLSLFPSFLLSIGLFNISSRSCLFSRQFSQSLSPDELNPPGFAWDDRLLHNDEMRSSYEKVPTLNEIYGALLILIWMYTTLALYFDQVLSSHHTPGQSWIFFLYPSFWGFGRSSSSAASQRPLNVNASSSSSTLTSASLPGGPSSSSPAGLVPGGFTENLGKVFKTGKVALHGLNMSFSKGRTLCLLGHNGAGKSTTINLLTGLLSPTSGNAFLFGKSIIEDMDDIRALSGVCMQHDILWEELTAAEHLRLFCRLKRVPHHMIEKIIKDLLMELDLWTAANKRAGAYSGGMKRRLSVAISCLGDSQIIFLDEPTTGLDPMSRRLVWGLIQRMKENRVVFLTTHSMEEADVLGDEIAIMVDGTLRCLGNPLQLKKHYGEGYRLNITAHALENNNTIKDSIRKILPASVLFAETGLFLIFTVPSSLSLDSLTAAFEQVEQYAHEPQSPVREWSISHTTFEEVFLKVTGPSH
eukprot:TRINITY_DN2285_c0_g1_i3.p1 TRINITY_DN2285_c0_g1~~TRINITY_DN2285_c0_g1_i3.p1  ORF type:complete len:889 (-),score=129.87 TRINITY_DN2285_c0_g1_i3:140-2806(-)